MSGNDISYLASGFHEDCQRLLEKFRKNNSITYEAFANVWREMKFSLVFLGRKNYAEMLEFCEETLMIAKHFFLSSTEFIDQIGSLFLLYGLYYKIPLENVKIRVICKDWRAFLDFYKQIKDEKLYDACFIFIKLVTDNAYHYCLFETEWGLEKSYKPRHDYMFENQFSVLSSIIEENENGSLSLIDKLSKVYDEQKAKLLNSSSSKNKLQLFNKNFVDEIVTQIDSLQAKKSKLSGMRRKPREITLNDKTEKIKYSYDDKIRPKLGHGFDTDSSDDENMGTEFAFVNTDDQSFVKAFDDNENDNENDNLTEPLQENIQAKIENLTEECSNTLSQ